LARSKALLLTLALAACSDAGPSGPSKPAALSISVSGSIERSDTVTLSASRGSRALPADSVQWSVTPSAIAHVLPGQQLQLLDTGAITVKATLSDTVLSRTFHVAAPPTIVFDMIDVNGSGTRTIFRMSLDGVGLTRLASDTNENVKPTSAAGIVVYSSDRTGGPSLFSVPLAGGAETSLDSLPYPASEAALSSDGTRLAFVTSASGNNKIWTSTTSGTGAAAVTTGLGGNAVDEENPTWSPAGDALVLVTTQYGRASLVQLSLRSSAETPLGDGTTTDVDPAWSPDGATLAFASTRDRDVGIFLRSFAGGAVTRLDPKPANDGQPAWLADGRVMYTSWDNANASTLHWIDPARPTVIHSIPTPAGSNPAHPALAQER
jgi:WD40-like Beta Propeller Repeat